MIKFLIKILAFTFLILNPLLANNQYFQEGKNLFENKKFKKAKLKFEQDIVYNPKNEFSYLYLSKIFKSLGKKKLQENNLKTVILINPKNEEATFILAKLKLENSDYQKSKEYNDRLSTFCNKYCQKSEKLKIEIKNLSQN